MPRLPRALLAALALCAAVVAIPASSPPVAEGLGAVPACRLDDFQTTPHDYDDWRTTLVDWILKRVHPATG